MYLPFCYCSPLKEEDRVTQQLDPGTGPVFDRYKMEAERAEREGDWECCVYIYSREMNENAYFTTQCNTMGARRLLA